MYGDKRAAVTVQFLVYEDRGTFEIHTAAIDGEVQPELVYSILLLKIFESYNGDGERGKLEPVSLGNLWEHCILWKATGAIIT